MKLIDPNILNDAENDFFKNIDSNSSELWNRIEGELKKKKIIPIWIYSIAASFTLFLLLGFASLYIIDNKNEQIVKLENNIEQILKQQNKVKVQTKYIKNTDTIFISKNIIKPIKTIKYKTVLKTIKETDTIYNTITQTVFDTIYINKQNFIETDTLIKNDTYFANLELEQENRINKLVKKQKFKFLKLKFYTPKNKSNTLNSLVVNLN